jgi:hypothetical protein
MELAHLNTKRAMEELAHRVTDGIDVTLFWHRETDELTVCVCDQKRGEYFEIRPTATQALDAFYHPYSYETPGAVDSSTRRLAA